MSVLRRHAARLLALAIVGVLYVAARPPSLGGEERRALAARFDFEELRLAEWPEGPYQTHRSVNPWLERHSGWMSAVGAAVALGDLDGDGLSNDVCEVDPRTDRATVAPVPLAGGPGERASGARYPIFELVPGAGHDRRTMAPMGCVPADVDEDGREDLLVYYWGRPPVVFLHREGAGMESDAYVAQPLAPAEQRWFTNAVTFADLDGDGHPDLVVGNYFQDGAHILDARAREPDYMQHSMSRAYNGGRNRIFRWVRARSGPHPTVAFEEVPDLFEPDVDHAWTLAVGAADLDGDLLPELYYANDFGPDRLFYNRSRPGRIRFALVEGTRRLVTPRSKVLGGDSFKGMGVDFADVNGDGVLDFFVSNIAAEYALLESHFLFVSEGDRESVARAFRQGRAPWHDDSERLGVARSSWAWDTRFGDFDNDGAVEALQATGFKKGETDRWPELQELATGNDELLRLAGIWPRFQASDDLSGHASNPFYVRARDGRFYDLAADLGLDAPRVSRGIATADVDGDGDLDFAVANQWEPSFLYRNLYRDERSRAGAPDPADFLGLHLLLPVGADGGLVSRPGHPDAGVRGRPAVGAEVEIRLPGGRTLVGQVDGGNGHSGVRSPELHFGLGTGASAPLDVVVRYRDRRGTPQELALQLEPGWHTLVLPDAARPLAWTPGAASAAAAEQEEGP